MSRIIKTEIKFYTLLQVKLLFCAFNGAFIISFLQNITIAIKIVLNGVFTSIFNFIKAIQ